MHIVIVITVGHGKLFVAAHGPFKSSFDAEEWASCELSVNKTINGQPVCDYFIRELTHADEYLLD